MAYKLSVAPMMDWTDRHCRVFHRRLSRRTLLYTEMVTARALLHGESDRLLRHAPEEHPLALQLGGSGPEELAEAVRIARGRRFCEINLNVGCPSDRVQEGTFGACLMRDPARVADCAAAMIEAAAGGPEITVKCRIGVDAQDPETALPAVIDACAAAGVRSFAVHARKAWLQGLSPKENRTVPPLDYDIVRRVRADRPGLEIVLNGGIGSLDEAVAHLAAFDGAMVGRAAYHDPAGVLSAADRRVFGEPGPDADPVAAVRGMYGYIEDELAAGARLNAITRHMLGAFAGRPGARRWRRVLSEGAHLPGAGISLLESALAEVVPLAA
ncbi:MAG TPA: tRNA dihydrouridine(20/20a) synthase DusA [Paracoccaceae bacterium]|nr:tRNA dihydrouridine(20/20a) synthase DusA [Paracoccaceae bacterium]